VQETYGLVFSGISQLGRTAIPVGTRQLPKCRLIIAVCAYPLSRDFIDLSALNLIKGAADL
jgi:hypothetical protein